jgi:hypothetical protein
MKVSEKVLSFHGKSKLTTTSLDEQDGGVGGGGGGGEEEEEEGISHWSSRRI